MEHPFTVQTRRSWQKDHVESVSFSHYIHTFISENIRRLVYNIDQRLFQYVVVAPLVQQAQVEHGRSPEILRATRLHLCSTQGSFFLTF
jgi:hypothetical protein